MERYTYQDGWKWRIRIGDTEHSGQWVDRLAAYEETGLEPGEIEQLKGEVFGLRLDKQELSALGPIDRLRELAQAHKENRVLPEGSGWFVTCSGKKLTVVIEALLSKLPAADVAEVRHGRWDASDRYKFLDGSTCIRCTECGAALHLDEYQKYHWHYCPNCGARMDEEDEHE
ncbi:hypothetical protein [Flavonifractor plautii]|uniref:hypothetical protein n=1 Tax=Flavonifractor plautii TaxID=292800 RepID=UPI00214AC884|nr:hypothetical protein [Flavonifractor plautii]MCR1907470.1 hypothetical protein [Flavonifractor plautii]